MGLFRLVALSLAALPYLQPAFLDAQNAAGKSESKRPALVLKASPGAGIAPIRVFLTGELKGGADDFEEYYCPSIEWSWGDGTISESSADCEPYEAGRSEIKRRFSVQHVFKLPGAFRVQLRLKRKDKPLATATTVVQILGTYGGDGR